MLTQNTLKAISFALEKHGDQKYGAHMHYGSHLMHVSLWGEWLIEAISSSITFREGEHEYNAVFLDDLRTAFPLHDTIEDADVSYSTLAKKFNTRVAELVFAVSGHGRNRTEKWELTKKQINTYPASLLVKFADRLANIEASVTAADGSHITLYREDGKKLLEFGSTLIQELTVGQDLNSDLISVLTKAWIFYDRHYTLMFPTGTATNSNVERLM